VEGKYPFQAGDIVLERDSWWIRWGTQHTGESKTLASHTGIGIDGQFFVEALNSVVKTPWFDFVQDHKPDTYEIWRHRYWTDEDRQAVANVAEAYLGRKYGYLKILLHAGDSLLGKIFYMDVLFFRRLALMDRYPICSWVTGFAVYKAVGYEFGVKPEYATPDDIADWVQTHEEWGRVA
jgi:hypothetical protein